jgi:acyl carrier protein
VLVDGDEGRVYLRLLAERRRLDKLAQLWVAGVDVDWRLLHEGASRRRVPLPTYPFERVRHWYDRHVIAEATPPAPAALPRVANGSAKRLAAAEKLAAEQLARPEPKTLMANAKPAKAALDPGAIRRTLRSLLAGVVFVDEDEIDDSRPFVDVGLDSLLGVEFVDRINKTFSAGAPIVDTDLYRRSSVADLADLLASRLEASGQ